MAAAGTGTTFASFSDFDSVQASARAGVWAPDPPAACGDVSKYKGGIVWGTEGDDTLGNPDPPGGNHAQIIMGLGGNDVINGGNSGDCLVGGDGNDILTGGNAKDIILGGPGDDTIDGGNGKDEMDGGDGGADTCVGGNGHNTTVNCEAHETPSSTDQSSLVVAPQQLSPSPSDQPTETATAPDNQSPDESERQPAPSVQQSGSASATGSVDNADPSKPAEVTTSPSADATP
jgi:Ca2+-binding RTX toxin-like protein